MADMGARETRLKIHMKLSFCIQTPRVNERILPRSNTIFKVTPPRNMSGQKGSAMQDSQRYRYNAAQCLLAAKEASQMPESLEKLDLLLLTVPKTRRVRSDGIHFLASRNAKFTV